MQGGRSAGRFIRRNCMRSWARPERPTPLALHQTTRLAKTDGSHQRDEAPDERPRFGRHRTPALGWTRLLFDFDDVPPYGLDRLITLGCKVRPGFRLIECHSLIQAIPF